MSASELNLRRRQSIVSIHRIVSVCDQRLFIEITPGYVVSPGTFVTCWSDIVYRQLPFMSLNQHSPDGITKLHAAVHC